MSLPGIELEPRDHVVRVAKGGAKGYPLNNKNRVINVDMKITDMMSAPTEDELNVQLYNRSRAERIKISVIWVVWKPKV